MLSALTFDYAMLVRLYGSVEGSAQERRDSPAKCRGAINGTVCRNPNEKHISTSFVERQNLKMRTPSVCISLPDAWLP
jgi:hypothetical protein